MWEEMPMAHRYSLECVNVHIYTTTGKGKPFGGKIFLGFSAVHQRAPIAPFNGKTETVQASIVSSLLLLSLSILCLDQAVHIAYDPEYTWWGDDIDPGFVTRNETEMSLDMIPHLDDIEVTIHSLYPLEPLAAPEE